MFPYHFSFVLYPFLSSNYNLFFESFSSHLFVLYSFGFEFCIHTCKERIYSIGGYHLFLTLVNSLNDI